MDNSIDSSIEFVKNNFEAGYVNGTLGAVIDCDEGNITVRTSRGLTVAVAPASWLIEGMRVATDATLADVSGITGSTDSTASWHAIGRVAVWLNYPYVHTVSYTS